MKDFELLLQENNTDINKVCKYYAYKFKIEPDELKGIVLEKLWKYKDNYKDQGFKFSSWVQQIAYNSCIDEFRKRSKAVLVSLPDDNFQSNSIIHNGRDYDKRNYLYSVYKKIRQRYPGEKHYNYRICMYMLGQGYKMREIADYLNVTEGTIKSIIHRVRVFLYE